MVEKKKLQTVLDIISNMHKVQYKIRYFLAIRDMSIKCNENERIF